MISKLKFLSLKMILLLLSVVISTSEIIGNTSNSIDAIPLRRFLLVNDDSNENDYFNDYSYSYILFNRNSQENNNKLEIVSNDDHNMFIRSIEVCPDIKSSDTIIPMALNDKLLSKRSKARWTEEDDILIEVMINKDKLGKSWKSIHNEFSKKMPGTNRNIKSLLNRYHYLISDVELKTISKKIEWTEEEDNILIEIANNPTSSDLLKEIHERFSKRIPKRSFKSLLMRYKFNIKSYSTNEETNILYDNPNNENNMVIVDSIDQFAFDKSWWQLNQEVLTRTPESKRNLSLPSEYLNIKSKENLKMKNKYNRWTEEEDNILVEVMNSDRSFREVYEEFLKRMPETDRNIGSIRSRYCILLKRLL